MTSLRSPEDLCVRLGLRPSGHQRELMHRFYEDEDPLEVEEIQAQQTMNAVALAALWRLLRVPGSKCIVISANRELEQRFLLFLREVTTMIDPALASVCLWRGSKCLSIGEASGHELRVVSNKPEWLQGLPDEAITFVILGARSSEPDFCETMRVIDTYRNLEGARHIVMW